MVANIGVILFQPFWAHISLKFLKRGDTRVFLYINFIGAENMLNFLLISKSLKILQKGHPKVPSKTKI
jgi:hypothetical protein